MKTRSTVRGVVEDVRATSPTVVSAICEEGVRPDLIAEEIKREVEAAPEALPCRIHVLDDDARGAIRACLDARVTEACVEGDTDDPWPKTFELDVDLLAAMSLQQRLPEGLEVLERVGPERLKVRVMTRAALDAALSHGVRRARCVSARRSAFESLASPARSLPRVRWNVYLHRREDLGGVRGRLEDMGATVLAATGRGLRVITSEQVAEVARGWPEVSRFERHVRPELASDVCRVQIGSERISGASESMAAFSSRGPADESRVKPDLVAPGTSIASTWPRGLKNGRDWGVVPKTEGLYRYLGGTSMAAPIVAGCAARVRQFYVDARVHPSPSAALLKATLINGARLLTGADSMALPLRSVGAADERAVPNFHQGFGCVDMAHTIPASEATFRLAFEDPTPGDPLAFDGVGEWKSPFRSHDEANNVLSVRVPDAAPGVYQLSVRAVSLLRKSQEFACVVTGPLAEERLRRDAP